MRKLNIENDPNIEELEYTEEKRIEEEKLFEEKEQQGQKKQQDRKEISTKRFAEDDVEEHYYSEPSFNPKEEETKKHSFDKPKREKKIQSINTRNKIKDAFRSNKSIRSSYSSNGNSKKVLFYIILFILIAVLFKWVILKNAGYTAVAMFVIIIVFMGHLRDK